MFYKVIDNVLPSHIFNEMADVICGDHSIPWYYSLVLKDDVKGVKLETINDEFNFQFIHTFYRKTHQKSETFYIIKPIIDYLNPSALLRIKANITPKTDRIVEHGFHIDNVFEQSLTAVFYLNDNNGYTKFESGDRVYSKKNRIVIFPTYYFHSGTTCTDASKRVVLNINYFK
jgi:hypothetical protein